LQKNFFEKFFYFLKIQLTEYGVLPQINPNNRVVKTFIRIFEVVNILKACAFLLRSISSELETENKPLFGAFNTRQVFQKKLKFIIIV